jgi:hypothetical protein
MRERCKPLQLIVLGVIATFAIQAIINLVVVTGLGPTKGIALPLMSSGGTGWIMTAFMLGVVVSINRTQEYSTLYIDDAVEDDASHFALRAARGSMIEAKPTLADRAVLFDHPIMSPTPLVATTYESQPDPDIQDDEMSQLLGETSPQSEHTPGLIARLRDRIAGRDEDDAHEPEPFSVSARQAGYSDDESERADLFS